MNAPDFLRFHCANTNVPHCSECSGDFMLPLSSIDGIYSVNGKAVFLVRGVHVFPNPDCPIPAPGQRFIESQMSYDDIISAVDGNVTNVGDVNLVQLDYFK